MVLISETVFDELLLTFWPFIVIPGVVALFWLLKKIFL